MKKNLVIKLFLISLITNSCFGQNDSKFSINGKTKNLVNGTILLLQNPLSNKFIDSVKVLDNTFVFNTQLTYFPAKLILWRDGSTAKTIWVENKNMTFDSSNSNFENAIINGSITDRLATSLKSKYKELKSYEEIVAFELEFIKNNPNNIISAHNLSIMAKAFGHEESEKLFNKFSIKNRQSQYGKIISDYLDLNITKTPQIGEKYVDFSMNNQNGIQKQLSELDGKYVLLEFWASWCLPCREENPELVKVYNKYIESNFEIFAVSLDENKENWIKAIKKDNLNWKHVSDLEGTNNKASLIYAVNGIPDNILIDKNGIIIARNLRSKKLDELLYELIFKKAYTIKKEKNGTTLRLSESIVWKDENGKILTKLEVEKMLDTKKYIPNLDTEKNIMVLKKKD
ncbi:TlpA disulfide reductase family protein [Psychroserpens ponticola]|uniref:TlpA disulfide reductase family protein n=1 Tax=Psychroserpens ponticola TaxID=2932268 RepID=A0ABY7S2C4_9FLAO|nr:TlpA disulfide reductase family protein [Psychroserpens ponticola]WCO03492.1 TlpA disulfide reductase family protein [Psychroserpens ponticola]